MSLTVKTLRKNDIPPESIVIEVTESRIARHRTNMLEVLTRLHLLGFSLSIDDFGTGYSSLDRLKELPFTELKIDRGFVSDAMKNEHGLAILRSSVQLARDFQMSIVAEGVENLETYNLVKTEDCDAVQGYFVAKPMSLNQLLDWLTRNSAPVKLAQ
ncbi:EAL domain-containing protein [Oleiphilus messinensis]|nr:EAL domain-containing protein [Oleiphilus messinensis]